MDTLNAQRSNPEKLRILMLHGFAQSARMFESKTKSLREHLESHIPPAPAYGYIPRYPGGIEFHFITAPIELALTDIPEAIFSAEERARKLLNAYGWWQRRGKEDFCFYEGLEAALQSIALALGQQGPFDGIMGVSQSGTAAAIVASSLEPGRGSHFSIAQREGGMPYHIRIDLSIHPCGSQ